MNDPRANTSESQLQFLQGLVEENASIAGNVVPLRDNLCAIHGFIPVDGDVLMAEFDSYDQATNILDQLSRRTRPRDES